MEEFKDILKDLRKRDGLTQREVSSLLGISQPSYIRYENGSSEPTITCLIAIADIFDVTLDELVGRTRQ
ncbi:MAG: helix-turn-helix transcriptional regulator [Clostridia bacterium]|nr:helix-turn-helix transcriptional regulator [Clostridia bacterium]